MKIKSHIVTEEDDDDEKICYIYKYIYMYGGARNMQENPSQELMDEE